MTRQAVSTVVLALVVVLVLWAMRAGWRARTRRSSALVPALPVAPADLGSTRLGPVDAVYVSTTRAGDWLDRVTAHDLGVRSRAQVTVLDAGVRITREGAADVFVPAASLRGASTAPGMAGKVVGGDGLVVLTWQADPADPRGLDTGLRPQHAADRGRLIESVTALTTGRAPAQEENS
ncbi:hypothetical protein [uncultured Cellulomonas sp.]|uniref:PH-like domain-containing protein n=1 Tax=uncultured Cellulomonas sp. TaxID=189682 RepID=UPI0028F1272A|nr:hypothetical protein [uncultured Cellulomonas sp.]